MADKISKFNGGMNSDISPIYQPDSTYVDAVNIELLSDTLQGSVAISNSKGNLLQTSLPNVGDVYTFSISTTIHLT